MPSKPQQQRFGGPRTRGRSVGTRAQRDRYLLVSGGIATEKEYFRYIRDALAASGTTLKFVADGRNPSRLLDVAVALKDEDKREAKRLNDRSNTYRRVWVVTDTDDFAGEILELVPRAVKAGVELVVSNPCFELYLVLHDHAFRKYCNAGRIQNEAKQLAMLTGSNSKNLVLDKLNGKFSQAEVFSQQLRQQHERNERMFPDNNPSTGVDTIVRLLIDSAERSIPGFKHSL